MMWLVFSLFLTSAHQPVLNESTYPYWFDYVRPSETEQAYRAIPWRGQLWTAVREAGENRRPILLWAMNGHPLGCT